MSEPIEPTDAELPEVFEHLRNDTWLALQINRMTEPAARLCAETDAGELAQAKHNLATSARLLAWAARQCAKASDALEAGGDAPTVQ